MSERLPRNYIPTHYDLYLHILPKRQYPFDATATITFQENDYSDKIYLNIESNITIENVTKNDTKLNYTVDYPKLIIDNTERSESNFKIKIEYKVTPNLKRMHGFFECNNVYLTNFEPTGARQLYPCFDDPIVRSTFSVKLLIPNFLSALSNMPIESIIEKVDEHEFQFQETPPICSYLLCVCIGTFSKISGKTKNGTIVEFYCNNKKEQKLLNYLNAALFTLNWIESTFSVKYELSVLQLVSIYGFGGGMENYGLITLSDCTEECDSIYKEMIVIHEIIHQWFGDIVSIKYWNSLWLNEGFAQFIEYVILNDYKNNSNAFQLFAEREARCCLKYFTSGILVPDENDVDFVHLFNSLVYSKGAFVLKMFVDLIGKNDFFKVCSNYLKEYKNKSVEVSDFVNIVNSTLSNDYSSFFDFWLKKSGFPVFVVTEIEEENKKVGFKIEYLNKIEPFSQLKVPIRYESNGEIKTSDVLINDELVKVDLEYDWIIVNDEIGSLCFVLYSIGLINLLRKLKEEKKISELNSLLIFKAINENSNSSFINDEMIQISKEFFIK